MICPSLTKEMRLPTRKIFQTNIIIQEFDAKQKIKMALTGNKEWRTILIRDNNKIVGESVLKTPDN
jgi:hypothetical protein